MTVLRMLEQKGRDVFSVEPDNSVEQVAKILAQKKIGAALVLEGGKVAGILSERDIVRHVAAHGAMALGQPVSKCMTKNVVSCSEHDSVDDVMEKMTQGRFRHIPVIEGDELRGLLSIGDVVKRKIELSVRDAEELKRYIAG